MRWITRDKTYYTRLFTLAIPVALQGLISFLVSFADNLMVNTLGDAAVSGVYMGNQLQTFLQMKLPSASFCSEIRPISAPQIAQVCFAMMLPPSGFQQ